MLKKNLLIINLIAYIIHLKDNTSQCLVSRLAINTNAQRKVTECSHNKSLKSPILTHLKIAKKQSYVEKRSE